MNSVIAIGEDGYWLAAVKKAGEDGLDIHVVSCDHPLIKCLDCLPDADINKLLLVDAFSKVDVSEIVSILSERGWRHIVVVAADPTSREVYRVLHESGGYDYWTKTYRVPEIRLKIRRCLDEIEKRSLTKGSEELRSNASRE